MLTLGFKQYKSNADVYCFIKKETRELAIAIVYVNNICFIGSKNFLLFLELKQKFIMKQEYYDLEKTEKFLKIYISYNCKN